MSEKQTGGPAFPGLNPEFTGISSDGQERFEIQPSGGMNMRDYFAAKCMQGLMANPDAKHNEDDSEVFRMVANVSYQMADAMLLEARK